jgi:RNA polymerase sigma factor (sigma-70 family)
MPTSALDSDIDLKLWKAMKGGSVTAFEQLYDRYFSILFGYGLQFCTDRAVIKDCLQDFFVDMYQGHSSLSDVQKVKQYLFVCFRHHVIRNMTSRHQLLESVGNNYSFQVHFSREDQLIDEQLDAYRKKMLKTSFARLSSRQKEAIFLRFYENMGYADIAEIMNMKETKYARTLVYRALVVLKEALKGHSLTLYTTLPFVNFLLKRPGR